MARRAVLSILVWWLLVDPSDAVSSGWPLQVQAEGSLSRRSGNTKELSYTYGQSESSEAARHTITCELRGVWSKHRGQPEEVDNLRIDLMDSGRPIPAVQPYAKLTYCRNDS